MNRAETDILRSLLRMEVRRKERSAAKRDGGLRERIEGRLALVKSALAELDKLKGDRGDAVLVHAHVLKSAADTLVAEAALYTDSEDTEPGEEAEYQPHGEELLEEAERLRRYLP